MEVPDRDHELHKSRGSKLIVFYRDSKPFHLEGFYDSLGREVSWVETSPEIVDFKPMQDLHLSRNALGTQGVVNKQTIKTVTPWKINMKTPQQMEVGKMIFRLSIG